MGAYWSVDGDLPLAALAPCAFALADTGAGVLDWVEHDLDSCLYCRCRDRKWRQRMQAELGHNPVGVAENNMQSLGILSWNIGFHRGPQVLREAVEAFYSTCSPAQGISTIFLLQECTTWGIAAGELITYRQRHHTIQMQLFSEPGCDCAIALPVTWTLTTRYSHFGNYFCMVAVGEFIFLSAHLLDLGMDGGRAEAVFFESMHHIEIVKSKFPHIQFHLIVGVDANVTLPPDHSVVTGSNTRSPLASHTPRHQREVLSWLEGLQVRALNTFGDHNDDNWTWCKNRQDEQSLKSQIDFIGATSEVIGRSWVLIDEGTLPFVGSDHRPVFGELSALAAPFVPRAHHPASLKGWSPATDEANSDYRRQTATAAKCSKDLADLEFRIHDIVHSIDYTTFNKHITNKISPDTAEIKAARAGVRETDPNTSARKKQ